MSAQQAMIDALRRAIDAHRARRFNEIAGDHEVEGREDCDPAAAEFLDAWQDTAGHQWQYGHGVQRDDWPRMAQIIIDDLSRGTAVTDPRVLERFARPHVTLRRFVVALGESGVTCPTCGYRAPEGTRCPECGRMVVSLRLFHSLRRWRAAAGGLLGVPLVTQVIAITFDRSDLFGLPAKPPGGAIAGFSWLLGPLFVLPMAATWSAFKYGRVLLWSLVVWGVVYGVCVVGFGLGLAITLYGIKYW